MATPATPHSPSPLHRFHQDIDQFVGDVNNVVNSTKKNGGVTSKELNRLAEDIEKLEQNANQILREGSLDEEIVIDAQIILGIITQNLNPATMKDREVSMLQAAKDYKNNENTDLKEVVKQLSHNDEEKDRLLNTIDRISCEILLRCRIEGPI